MANVEEIEQATQQRLTDAQKALDSVNYKELGAEAKEHYDRAQGFVNQARIALKIKNYVYAEQLSKNAATLASALRKR